MITEPVHITVSTVERSYLTAWDAAFAKEIADGSTTVRTSKIMSGSDVVGKSILKIAHSEVKGIRRDQIMIRDSYSPTVDVPKGDQDQVYLVMSGRSEGNRERLLAATLGFLAYLNSEASPIDEVLDGQG